MVHRFAIMCGALLLMLSIAGPAAAQTNSARVRVIHAAPDAPEVDVFVDGKAVLEGVGFLDISDYLDLPAGQHTVAVAPAGEGEDAAVVTANPTLESGAAYTVGVTGSDKLTAQVYTDNISPVPSGKARVRAIHTLSDAPSVDVEVVGGPTLFEQITFPNASDYAEVDAGTYDLRLVAAGANTVFTAWPATTVEAGTIYDIVVFGNVANLQTQVAVTTPSSNDLGGSAPTAPATMPNTGVETNMGFLFALGVLLLGVGAANRRWVHS
jgi:LPXTG-motif cell wall-anchored protein